LREKVDGETGRMRDVVATSPDKAALAPLTRPFGPPLSLRGRGFRIRAPNLPFSP
jgi:hypothetical protein